MSKIMELVDLYVQEVKDFGRCVTNSYFSPLLAEVSSVEAELKQAYADRAKAAGELLALKAEKLEREKQSPYVWLHGLPLYLAPGAGSVPMTDKEIAGAWIRIADPVALGGALPRENAVREFVRAIEAHHKIGVKL